MANWWDDAPLATAEAARPSITPQARDLAIRTVYGEAGAEPDEGKAGVAAVIRNRVQSGKFGKDVPSVVMAPNQFEPWSRPDARNRMMSLKPGHPDYERIGQIVDGVFSGATPDPTNGATHFFAPEAQAALGRKPPSWAKGEAQAIGRHTFYAPEGKASTDISAQSRKPATNWWDDAPLAREAQSAPAETASSGNGPKKPDRGMVDAAARGVAAGLTANFGDEISGVENAAPGWVPKAIGPIPARAIVGGARLAANAATGMDPKAVTDYTTGRDETRARNKEAEENYPITSIAGNVAGSVILPVGGAVGAATLPVRLARGAGVGAAFGAASGAGEGEGLSDSLAKAGTGAAVGGAVGAAAVPAISLLEAGGRGIAKLAQPITTNVRGALNRDAEAARRILAAEGRDAKTANPGMSDAEFAAAKASGLPVVNADRGGETVQALARSAANTSPEGRAALEAVTSDRYRAQNPRTAQYLKETFDFPEPGAALDRIHAAARMENRPAYNKAYAQGQSIWDDGLDQYTQAPIVQKAIQLAFVTGRNKAAMDGFPVMKNPFVLNKETGVLELAPGATPNLQFWDHVKRNLDQMGAEGQAFSKALRNHLDEIVPSYADARAGAAKYFGAEDALEAGAKYATMSGRNAMALSEVHKGLSKMGPADRKLFQTGFVSNLIAKVEDLKDGQDVVKNIFNSEHARNQIKLVLGENRAAELEARLTTERAMNGIKNAIQGNSTTARQWIERGMAGGASGLGGVGAYNNDPQAMGAAALAGILAAGSRKIDQRVARRVAEMLASDNPDVLKAGTKMVAQSQALREAFRSLNVPAARAGGGQAPIVPALQAAGIGRADDQPGVPRPPSQ